MSLNKEPLGNTKLMRVREGMDVYDSGNHHIGSVSTVYFGADSEKNLDTGTGAAEADNPDKYETDSLVKAVAQTLDPNDLPEELRERLWQQGFIRINSSGLLASDRYALPEQIASVGQDGVHLNTDYDSLLAR